MKPSNALQENREAVRTLVQRHKASNPRVFGSVARGEDRENSDIDILVDALPGTSLLDLIALEQALTDLLGAKVDLATVPALHRRIRQGVLEDARAI